MAAARSRELHAALARQADALAASLPAKRGEVINFVLAKLVALLDFAHEENLPKAP